jgi:hypothetical protein
MSVMPEKFSVDTFYKNETRSDIAKRIGSLVLEAIEDMPEDKESTVLLPLDDERDSLHCKVALALLPLAEVLEEIENYTEKL